MALLGAQRKRMASGFMSYDFDLKAKTGPAAECVSTVWSWSGLTYNLGDMMRAAGFDPRSLHGESAVNVKPVVLEAIRRMESDPHKFAALNPSNGWGDSDGLLKFFSSLAGACEIHPFATLVVT